MLYTDLGAPCSRHFDEEEFQFILLLYSLYIPGIPIVSGQVAHPFQSNLEVESESVSDSEAYFTRTWNDTSWFNVDV